eukprot:7406556-Pyramimonas_sp.AAC.1
MAQDRSAATCVCALVRSASASCSHCSLVLQWAWSAVSATSASRPTDHGHVRTVLGGFLEAFGGLRSPQ